MKLLQRNNKKQKVLIVIFAVVIFLFLLFNFTGVFNFFSRGATSLAVPFWRTESYLNEQGVGYALSFKTKKELVEENDRLNEELEVLRVQSLSRDLLIKENSDLKEILGRNDKRNSLLLSVILTKPNRSPYDTFIIDVGFLDDISKGDKVMAYGDIIIGLVDKVNKNTSLVKLFSSPGEKIDVIIGTEDIAAVAYGTGSGNFKIELPRGVDIKEKDSILSPSVNISIIGIVDKIEVNSSDSFQTIIFKSPINLYQLKWVEVLRN